MWPDPIGDYVRLDAELRRVIASLEQRRPKWSDEHGIPPTDVEETADDYLIDVELPLAQKDQVQISVSGRRVIVTDTAYPHRNGTMSRLRRNRQPLRLEFELPAEIDADSITASLDSGVLSLRVPKRKPDRSRPIEVT